MSHTLLLSRRRMATVLIAATLAGYAPASLVLIGALSRAITAPEMLIALRSLAIPTAQAATPDADDIALRLDRIRAYTELAAEIAEKTSDPLLATELLENVQRAQVDTSRIIAKLAAEPAMQAVTTPATTAINETVATVDVAIVEARDAARAGEAIRLDIPTDVEDYLAAGRAVVPTRRQDPAAAATLKIEKTARDMLQLRHTLSQAGWSDADITKTFEPAATQLTAARDALRREAYTEALSAAQTAKRDVKNAGLVASRIAAARAHVGSTASSVASSPLADTAKPVADIIAARKAWQAEAATAVAAERDTLADVSEQLFTRFVALTKDRQAGTITDREFQEKRQAILAAEHEAEKKYTEQAQLIQQYYQKRVTGLAHLDDAQRATEQASAGADLQMMLELARRARDAELAAIVGSATVVATPASGTSSSAAKTDAAGGASTTTAAATDAASLVETITAGAAAAAANTATTASTSGETNGQGNAGTMNGIGNNAGIASSVTTTQREAADQLRRAQQALLDKVRTEQAKLATGTSSSDAATVTQSEKATTSKTPQINGVVSRAAAADSTALATPSGGGSAPTAASTASADDLRAQQQALIDKIRAEQQSLLQYIPTK